MKYLIYLGHPAQFHLFKNIIKAFKDKGHIVLVLIKKKDILEDLLKRSGIDYQNIFPEGYRFGKMAIALGTIKIEWRLFRFCLAKRPDLLMGTPAEIAHMGTLLRIPSVTVHEDDAAVIPLYCKYSHPWSTHILSPRVCYNAKWEKKSIKYESYHELAYLHPGNFKALKEIVRKYLDPDQPYFLIRFSNLSAHHDTGIRGISDELALKIIAMLKPYGRIFITSERPLSEQFESFRLNIDPMEIHHVMAFAQVYVGDSQTMAAEAGVLGVPFLRFNDFVGRIGYLKELEETYELGYGIRPSEPELFLNRLKKLLEMKNRLEVFQNRRAKMLEDKIDLSQFMIWFFENYPQSVQTMRENPDYQYNFR